MSGFEAIEEFEMRDGAETIRAINDGDKAYCTEHSIHCDVPVSGDERLYVQRRMLC